MKIATILLAALAAFAPASALTVEEALLDQLIAKGAPEDGAVALVGRVPKGLDAETLDELSTPPNYGLHPLTGDRAGTWAMTVTRNWRMTFRINAANAIEDLDLEDYH